MYKLIMLLGLALSVNASAATSLRVALFTEEGLSMDQLNKKLAAKRLPTVPEYFELSTNDPRKASKEYSAVSREIEDAIKKLGLEDTLSSEIMPNSEHRGTCYNGKAGQPVVDLVFALTDSYYSGQMNLWGWKYKNQQKLGEYNQGDSDYDPEDMLQKRSKLWKTWRGEGEAMLLVLAVGDDGDDVNEVIIPKCR
jgi:hypothetical protein